MKPLFLFMAVVFAAGQSFAANRFGALVEGYSNPKAGASAAVSNVDYSFGHLKLNLASGNAAPVTAAGNTVAIFFTGNGTFTYVSDDPVEFPIVTRNTRGESHLKLETSGKTATISGPVSEVLLYAAGTPLPPIGAGSGAVGPEFAAHLEEFGRNYESSAAHGMHRIHRMVPPRLEPANRVPAARRRVNGGTPATSSAGC